MPIIINGREISKQIKNELKEEIINNNLKPGLGIILVGERPDSKIYVRMKKLASKIIEINVRH